MIDTTPGPANQRVTLCSSVSEASGEDPAGSAWAVRRMILMELALPWPYDVLGGKRAPEGLHDLVHEVYASLSEPWGLIGIAPDPEYSVEGMTRIIDMRQGSEVATAYQRDTYLVPNEGVVEWLRLLCYEPYHPRVAARRQPDDQETREFFICTHGAIDACCATVGYPIYKLMRSMADSAPTPTRVWRCTHFGGHRFAATVLEAPQGRYWGHLKAETLAGLMRHDGAVDTVRRHYRGWAALPDPMWQIAEAEVFTVAGWNWCQARITSVAGDATRETGGTLKIAFNHPATGNAQVEVRLEPNGSVMTMDTSRSKEFREAPQFVASVVAEHPERCLSRIGNGSAQ